MALKLTVVSYSGYQTIILSTKLIKYCIPLYLHWYLHTIALLHQTKQQLFSIVLLYFNQRLLIDWLIDYGWSRSTHLSLRYLWDQVSKFSSISKESNLNLTWFHSTTGSWASLNWREGIKFKLQFGKKQGSLKPQRGVSST